MTLILPHGRSSLRCHTALRYLWRVRCLCGWYALAPSEHLALLALQEHISEEEPFPDLYEEFGIEPEPGSQADLIRKSKGEL